MKRTISILLIFTFVFGFGQSLNKQLKEIIKDKKATVAVSVLDFETSKSVSVNGNKNLPMLSVFKFHVALAVLSLVDEGKLSLDQKILVKKSDLKENTWSPMREMFPNGNFEMPLSLIIKYTVAESDNNGCDILLELIGGPQNAERILRSKGAKGFTIKVNEDQMHQGYSYMYKNSTSTNTANELLKAFAERKVLSKTSTDFLMNTMIETSTGKNKLIAKLPASVALAHKTGSSGKDDTGKTIAENDIGIVTLPNGKQYAISVFVSDSMESEEVNTGMIADISEVVYKHFSQKK
jgi:beta-lactamase class A